MKIQGHFSQSAGGRCTQCKIWFNADEEYVAVIHFEKHHGWECLHHGTEMTGGDDGFYHCAVYAYGTSGLSGRSGGRGERDSNRQAARDPEPVAGMPAKKRSLPAA
jgi:hypothetical protein